MNNYIKGIDGLRAWAVLSVIFFHLKEILMPGGFAGVDVFFVISGYVVTGSLFKYANVPLSEFIFGFYARRILRIFPAMIFMLLLTSIVVTLFIPSSWLSGTTMKTGLLAFVGLGNYALIWFNDGYFAPRVTFNFFTHTWSLGVEEQFYLFFPPLMFFWFKYKNNQEILGKIANMVLPLLLFISLYYASVETFVNSDKAYYLLPSRFWELACGALLYILHNKGKFLPTTMFSQQVVLFVGTLFIVIAFVFSDKHFFPFPWAIVSVLGAMLLIAGVRTQQHEHTPFLKKMFENNVLVQIGKASYSLYLWHWPIFVFMRWTTGLNTIVEMLFALILTFIVANISYYYVEKPIRTRKSIVQRSSKQIVFYGIAIIGFFSILSLGIFKSQSVLSLSVTKDKETWYPHAWHKSKRVVSDQNISKKKLFVIGDSHAGAYTTMLQQLTDEYGVEVIKYSRGGCAIANLMQPEMTRNKQCNNYKEEMMHTIKASASPGDILFLASLRVKRLGDEWALFSDKEIKESSESKKAESDRKEALIEAENFLKEVNTLQLHIIIDAPKPIFKSPPFRCADWYDKDNPICVAGFEIPKTFLLKHRKSSMDALAKLKSEFPQLIVWDPFPVLCPSNICSAFDGSKPLFFDGDHLSAHGNDVLYPSFVALVKKLL